jgi:dephospho-CoA kinase
LCDEIWVVVVSPDVAIARLAKRNGFDESAARARISSQLSNEQRIAAATIVLDNTEGDESTFIAKVDELVARRLHLTAKI